MKDENAQLSAQESATKPVKYPTFRQTGLLKNFGVFLHLL